MCTHMYKILKLQIFEKIRSYTYVGTYKNIINTYGNTNQHKHIHKQNICSAQINMRFDMWRYAQDMRRLLPKLVLIHVWPHVHL